MSDYPAVGANVRKERQNRKLSLEALAEQSRVSKAMLSQIESGKVNPTIMTVWKIAQALKVDFNVLLKGQGDRIRKFTISRYGDLPLLDTENDGVRIRVLTPLSQAEDLELYLVTLKPGAILASSAHYEGTEEYLTILDGEAAVSAGKNSTILHTGDVLIYQSDIEHAIANRTGKEARIHMVVRFAGRNR
ncbi:MAG: helix-turn-helix transcriptional regulator [Lentisphaeria bacterium]|nr:helix-turn-helix transcriptional regulator [Lentisphaeria bacterium]